MTEELPQNVDEISAYIAAPDVLQPPPEPTPVKSPEEVLTELLLSIEGDKITFDAFQFLFELLVNYSNEYQKHGRKKLKNLFNLIFSLLRLSDDIQIKVVKELLQLIESQPSVRQFCKDTEWLTSLLQFLPSVQDNIVLDGLMKLVETLAQYHISAKQVKLIFHLLQSANSQFKAYYWTHIFQQLQRLWHGRTQSPDNYFDFDGIQSGLVLPAIKFPTSGYSICTWFRIEAFSSPFVKDAYMPYLYCFMTDEGLGIETFFSNDHIVFKSTLSTKSSSKRNSLKPVNYNFLPRKWYCLVITHVAHFIRSDELCVYVDGQLVQSLPIGYPKLDKPAKLCRLGSYAGAQPSPKYALRGQMAGFVLFEDVLTPDDVKSLYALGPKLFNSLQGVQELTGSQRTGLFSQKKARPVLFYSPKATNNGFCLEPLSRQPDKRALLLDGVRVCLTSGIQESLYSVGGIQLLLPLFSTKYRPKLGEPIDVNMKVISLIADLVRGNAYYQTQLLQTRFFEIMGHLLADPQFSKSNVWSPQAVVCLEELSQALYSFNDASANSPTNEMLFRQFFRHIYLNFRIWNNTDISVQKILLHSIYSHVKKDPEFFRSSLLTAEFVLNILAEYFSYITSRPLQPTDRDWSKFPRNSLLELRWMLLEILRLLFSNSPTFSEIKNVITYLHEENQKPEDKRLIVDVLQVILTLIADNPTTTIPHLQKLGSFKPFLSLLRTSNDRFRVWTLKVIGKLYQWAQTDPAGPEEIEANLASLKKVLEPNEFTYNIYNALLEIVLDSISVESLENPIVASAANTSKTVLVIKNMKFVSIIFELLGVHSDIELRDKVVKDFIWLLQSHAHNRIKFLQQPSWQAWVFGLLVHHTDPASVQRETSHRLPSLAEQRLQASVTDMVSLLLEHALFDDSKTTHLVFETTRVHLAYYRGSPNFDAASVAETIATKVMRTLLENADILTRASQSPSVWQNIVYFLLFVEEFLFQLPTGVSSSTVGPLPTNLEPTTPTGGMSASFPTLPPFSESTTTSKSPKLTRSASVSFPSTPAKSSKPQSSLHASLHRQSSPPPVSKDQTPSSSPASSQPNIEAIMSSINQLLGTATEPKPNETCMPAQLVGLKLHYDSRGLWRAFSAVQKLLEFLDSFLQIKFATNPFDEITDTYSELTEWLRKFQLRLVVYSIKESAAYKSTHRLKMRKDSFVNIKSVVETNFKDMTSIQNSLERYLLKKTQQWDLQMSDVDTMSQKNLKRIRDLLINCRHNQTAFYLFCFIHSVKQLPDIGKDEMFDHLLSALFEIAAFNVKARLLDMPEYAPIVREMEGESVVQAFSNILTNTASSPLRDLFVHSTYLALAEEISSIKAQKELTRKKMIKLTEQLLVEVADEMEKHKKYQEEFELISRSFALEATEARAKFKIRQSQYSSLIASEWKYILRLLTDSRGPWATRKDVNEKIYWKLDNTETRTRMRLKLKRQYGDVSALEHASKLNDLKKQERQLQSASSPSQQVNTVQSDDGKHELLAALPKGKSAAETAGEKADDEGAEDQEHVQPDVPPLDSPLNDNVGEATTLKKKKEEKTIFTTQAEFIRGITVIQGDFEVTNMNVYFSNLENKTFKTIPVDKIMKMYSRRYMLQATALEIFTTNRTSYFFNFSKQEDVSLVVKHIVALRPPHLGDNWYTGHPSRLMKKKKHITEAWRRREISNFEYLMELNTIAGRTYNDLGQYPVFPWIIADYTSQTLDLNNPAVYRDLSKPIGALDPTRLKMFLERWENFGETNVPRFLYGSHYSSMAIVLYYLVRLEPYSSHLVSLQGGQFDIGARMFWSLPKTWENCLVNPTDVKELIPEFFYLPEFLICTNDVNLGALPNGMDIKDVELPPWADSAHTFIQLNRAALESEYVSQHLHEWIDLIFGYKQQGQAAIDAHNVFYYLTYEGAVDIDQITDPVMKQSVLSQIREFGQTPCQLFTQPHPPRYTLSELASMKRGITNMLENVLSPQPEVPTPAFLGRVQVIRTRFSAGEDKDVIHIHVNADQNKIHLVFKDGLTFAMSYKPPTKSRKFPLQVGPSAEPDILSSPQKLKEHELEMIFSSAVSASNLSQCVAFTPDSRYIIHCGNWDNSFLCSSVADTSQHYTIVEHKDVVTCVALCQNTATLVTGSNDCNCLLWDFESILKAKRDKSSSPPKPRKILTGHDEGITCVAVNSDLDIVVTASLDCTCIISSLTKGRYFRTIQHDAPVSLVTVSPYGEIISYCPDGELLYLHSLNGKLLKKIYNVGKLSVLKLSQNDGRLLITAGHDGGITVRTLHLYSLRKIWRWQCPMPVTSLELTPRDEYLLIGLKDGTVLAVVFDMNNLLTDMCCGSLSK